MFNLKKIDEYDFKPFKHNLITLFGCWPQNFIILLHITEFSLLNDNKVKVTFRVIIPPNTVPEVQNDCKYGPSILRSDVKPRKIVDDPYFPFYEGDFFSQSRTPGDKAPNYKDGKTRHDRIESNRTDKRNFVKAGEIFKSYPWAFVLKN